MKQAIIKNQTSAHARAGFSLIETMFALLILMIALLGVFQVFTYAIVYNAGNATRSHALAILQQKVELLRSKKFSPTSVDPDLAGGVKPVQIVPNVGNSGSFRIETIVDDRPWVDNAPGAPDIDATSDYKEITITARLDAPSPGWQLAVPATIVMRRTRGN